MNIRSVTCFVNAEAPNKLVGTVRSAAEVAAQVRAALESGGFPVQTTRLATQSLSLTPDALLELARRLSEQCAVAGFEYLSLGPVAAGSDQAGEPDLNVIPRLIHAADSIFCSVQIATKAGGVQMGTIRNLARTIGEVAHSTDMGFGNLRLAALANVGPHSPFFPAAYHDGGTPALALATESADVAVTALSDEGALEDARGRLVSAVESVAGDLVRLAMPLAERHNFRFAGIDFSLAPFPELARSIGAAVEQLGVERFGAPGTLFAASFLTDCLRRAHYPHCGFNGLMLPVLEDAVLAGASRQKMFTVNDLLLYSAVCGTGLDTVPLPGDVTEDELAGILLDVATLALCLDKPLTARLMPIPGARAGDLTEFDFPYFASGRVLDVKGMGSPKLFERGGTAVL